MILKIVGIIVVIVGIIFLLNEGLIQGLVGLGGGLLMLFGG